MRVTRISPMTGKLNTMDLPITLEQVAAYNSGVLLQFAFPDLNPEQREFYHTGYTTEDWTLMFPPKTRAEEAEEECDAEQAALEEKIRIYCYAPGKAKPWKYADLK